MSILDDIGLFFSRTFHALLPFIKQFFTDAGKILLNTATKVVFQIAADPSLLTASGAEKRQIAYDAIVKDLTAAGITLGTSVINGAIEAAVAALKAEPSPVQINP